MKIKKLFTKYALLLLIYILIVRFIEPYGLRLYYSLSDDPMSNPQTIDTIQSVLTLINFIINLIFVVFMIIDSKSKKVLEWLIILVTFFSPEAGITIFLVWQIYKELHP